MSSALEHDQKKLEENKVSVFFWYGSHITNNHCTWPLTPGVIALLS